MPSIEILYSNKDHKRVESLLKDQQLFMACIGQTPWILDDKFPKSMRLIGRFMMRFYSFLMVLITFITGIQFVKQTLDMLKYGELDEITDALTQAIISAFSCFSSCYWLWHSKELAHFIELINKKHWHHSLAGLTFVSSHGIYEKSHRFALVWIAIGTIGSVVFGLTPLLRDVRALPLQCWYPFDPLQSSFYPIVYLSQLFTQFDIGGTFSCGSALYVSFIFLIIGQLDVLFCSLKNIKYHAELTSGQDLQKLRQKQQCLPLVAVDEINQYVFLTEERTNLARFENMFHRSSFNLSLKESFNQCVELHCFIFDCCSKLEELFHPFCLLKSLQMTLQLCLLCFVGVAGERSPQRFLNLFIYLVLTLSELVMFCFFGELLKEHSTRAGDALFRSEWYDYSMLLQRDINIFLSNTKRTVQLTAGKFFVMDLERLRLVVTQAFSFLTLLQNIAEKN